MNSKTIIEKLEIYNDPDFNFDPTEHKYTYKNETYISVTQFLSRFHKEFDSDYWSNIKATKLGVTQEEILSKWKDSNEYSTRIGTAVHNWIENYYNKIPQDLPTDLDIIQRINKFNILYAKHLHKLEPVKFEQKIFSKKWKIAGMIDSLFIYKDNLYIKDWKTNKQFTFDEHEKGKFEYLLSPFEHEYKNNLNEYSIQLNLYKIILKEIGIDVKACYLVHIGPDNGEAQLYRTKDYTKILEDYLLTLNNND
jgi:ATP-dependent exoDNAse (exonuclease V) beta subunit